MPLSRGTQLGPYEIVAPLGAGGMGEVYRARDTRLGREVAVKVLPTSVAGDTDRLRRFELEAKSASQLNHPNILAVYDVGTHDGAPYVVSELLEGQTLRQRMGVARRPRRCVDHAVQIANGLAAAHEKGIVHRDLKPENLFLTNDGRIKILDFGLVKLTQPALPGLPNSAMPTISQGTDPGTVIGTIGYMSPEQVRGQATDSRSDIFSFGVILYEMLSGRRAFKGDTAADTMTAILKEEPPELSAGHSGSPALERIARHCLEKTPEARFQSARDLAFALEALSGGSEPTAGALSAGAGLRWPAKRLVLGLSLVPFIAGLGFLVGRTTPNSQPPSFKRLTFRSGRVDGARFTPDGSTVLYSASWDGSPREVFSVRPESPVSQPVGLKNADVAAVSASGEMAVLLMPDAALFRGTLARIPLAGGTAKEIVEGVAAADAARDGQRFAIVRSVEGRFRLEYPVGSVLYEAASNYIYSPRVSPTGDRVAFVEGVAGGSLTRYTVSSVDLAGRKATHSRTYNDIDRLAWMPDGREILFSGAETGLVCAIYAVTLSGKERLLLRAPGSLTVEDISSNGRVLIKQISLRTDLLAVPPGGGEERELSTFGTAFVADVSRDGRTLLYTELGEASGREATAYVGTLGSQPVRIADGTAMALSPDGKSALVLRGGAPSQQLFVAPLGAGQPTFLEQGGLAGYEAAAFWCPDGKSIVFVGHEPGRGPRYYLQDLAEGKPRPITPEMVATTPASKGRTLSPDGRFLIAVGPGRKNPALYPLDGSAPIPVKGVEPGDLPIGWSEDGRSVFVRPQGFEPPARIYRVELATARRTLWKELRPRNAAGAFSIVGVHIVGRDAYAYVASRLFADLYLAEGLR